MSLGFDKDYYLAMKLKDIQAKHPDEWKDKTVSDLESFFKNDHNLTPEQHYEKYGYKEGLAPNKFFDAQEYLASKYNQMVKSGKAADIADAKAKFAAGWGDNDPYLHYIKYGASEGVNPSNAFDESSYIDAKVKQMVASGKFPDEASALKAFEASGLSALEHYIAYGIKEDGIDPVKVSDEERVSIEGKTLALAKGTDILLPEGAALPEGVKEDAVKRTSSDDDVITALTSSLSSEKTLDSSDQIDGGDGKDTLKLTLKSAFTGFTGTGKMVNVENLELKNDSSIDRTFSAKGVTGLEKIKIDASKAVTNVSDLNALAAVELENFGDDDFSLAYSAASAVVTDTSKDDVQKIILKGVGVDKTDTTAIKYTDLTIAKVEVADITSSGDKGNFVNLADLADVKKIVVDGDAALNIKGVAGNVTSFDASKATGAIVADLGNSGTLTSVKTGSGNDAVTVNLAKLLVNSEIDGGAGTDTLVVDGGSGTFQPAMKGIETLDLKTLGGDLTFASKNVSDLSKVIVRNVGDYNVSFVQSPIADLTLEYNDAFTTHTAGKAVLLDNAGATTINYAASDASVKAASTVANNANTTLSNSTALTINVGKYMNAAGKITAAKAESFTLNVESGLDAAKAEQTEFSGDIVATAAQSFTIDAKGKVTGADITASKATSAKITTGAVSSIDLETPDMESLDITAGKDLTLGLHNSSNLNKLQVLNVNTNGVFTANANMIAMSDLTLAGAASTSKVDLDVLGADDLDYDLNITATGLKAGLVATDIKAGKASANIDVSGVLGDVTFTSVSAEKSVIINANGSLTGTLNFGTVTGESVDINASQNMVGFDGNKPTLNVGKDVTFVGSALKVNKVDINATGTELAANLTGGLDVDTYKITTDNAKDTSKIVVKGDLGLGANVFGVDASNENSVNVSIDATGLNIGAGTATLKGGDKQDTIKGTSGKDVIEGNADVDTIYGNDGDDVITGGAGNDVLYGGAGKDTFKFATATDGVDTIKDFNVSDDKYATDFNTSASSLATPAISDQAAGNGNITLSTGSSNSDVIEITGTLNASNIADDYSAGAEVLKAIVGNGNALSVTNNADKCLVVLYNEGNAYIYEVDAGSGDTSVAAGEIKLVGTLEGVEAGGLTAANFANV